ncbi:MFS transporter, partial [Escherichia coli]|nr:MFS transporter [Escherichia coli]
ISLVLNLLFAFVGGLLAVRYVPRFGAWRMSLAGYACQLVALLGLGLIGRPEGATEGVLAVAMLALFLFVQGFGPGAQTITFA